MPVLQLDSFVKDAGPSRNPDTSPANRPTAPRARAGRHRTPVRYRASHPCPHGYPSGHRSGRLGGDYRALGLRQVDAAQYPRLPGPADDGHLPHRRHRHHDPDGPGTGGGAQPADRVRLPVVSPPGPIAVCSKTSCWRRSTATSPRPDGASGPSLLCSGSGSGTVWIICRRNSPAASVSG